MKRIEFRWLDEALWRPYDFVKQVGKSFETSSFATQSEFDEIVAHHQSEKERAYRFKHNHPTAEFRLVDASVEGGKTSYRGLAYILRQIDRPDSANQTLSTDYFSIPLTYVLAPISWATLNADLPGPVISIEMPSEIGNLVYVESVTVSRSDPFKKATDVQLRVFNTTHGIIKFSCNIRGL